MSGAYKKLTGQNKAAAADTAASPSLASNTSTGVASPGAAAITASDTTAMNGEVRGTAGLAARALAFQDEASRRRPASKILLGS